MKVYFLTRNKQGRPEGTHGIGRLLPQVGIAIMEHDQHEATEARAEAGETLV